MYHILIKKNKTILNVLKGEVVRPDLVSEERGAWKLDHLPALPLRSVRGSCGRHAGPGLPAAPLPPRSDRTSYLGTWLSADLASELIGLSPGPWKNKSEFCAGVLGSYSVPTDYRTVLKGQGEVDWQGCVAPF